MHSLKLRNVFLASLLALGAAACSGGADPVNGSWNQPNGTIDIPPPLGGGTLDDDVTLTFNDTASPPTFDLKMVLSFQGLQDTLEAQGTYKNNGGSLTLDFTGFVLASGSGDTQASDPNSGECVTLNAMAGATVCFPTPQTDNFQINSNTLTIAINNQIVGAPVAPTTLTLSRVK